MSVSRVAPASGAVPQSPDKAVTQPPTGDDLAQALSGLAEDLTRDGEATRLARAQSQVEALHYAAQLAAARGDLPALKALSAEALRVGRDLSAAGLPADRVAPILEQARRVGGDRPPPDDTA
ncbi:MAG: hypothetical protein LDL39_09160 [Magnetospirillum sp.]|nr:hypothetical protein [Magnetospirillum sp.]